jgi:hypothetical protein
MEFFAKRVAESGRAPRPRKAYLPLKLSREFAIIPEISCFGSIRRALIDPFPHRQVALAGGRDAEGQIRERVIWVDFCCCLQPKPCFAAASSLCRLYHEVPKCCAPST